MRAAQCPYGKDCPIKGLCRSPGHAQGGQCSHRTFLVSQPDAWRDLLQRPAYLATFRHPVEVARSVEIRQRARIAYEQALNLRIDNNQRLLDIVGRIDSVHWFNYNQPAESLAAVRLCCRQKHLPWDDKVFQDRYDRAQAHNRLTLTTYPTNAAIPTSDFSTPGRPTATNNCPVIGLDVTLPT